MYRETYDMSRTLLWNKIIDHSDVAGAAPTKHWASMDWAKTTARRDETY